MSLDISMKALLESGVHFGHRTNRWDPRMKPYIFTERNGIHIIDLQQTVERMRVAYKVVRDIVAEPLVIHRLARGKELDRRVAAILEKVGLRPEHRA